jgi:hypothetical protein
MKERAITGYRVTFRLTTLAYTTIMEEAVERAERSTLLPQPCEALIAAASLPDGVWIVDCTEEASRDIEYWFERSAEVESATPKGDADRFATLAGAVRAIRGGREKSRRERRGV